jgi:large subunit ribosomal protein L21
MYAVIENGGKQYRVELGVELELDKLSADPGETIDIGRVLLVADGDEAHIGAPVVEGARVTGEVVRPMRGEKLIVFKYRPKARSRVKHGHRQDLTLVRVADIEFGGRSAAKEAQAEAEKQQAERAVAAKAAETKAKADRTLADKLAKDKAAEVKEAKAKDTKAKADQTKPKTTAKSTAAKPAAKTTTTKITKAESAKATPTKPKGRTTTKKEE